MNSRAARKCLPPRSRIERKARALSISKPKPLEEPPEEPPEALPPAAGKAPAGKVVGIPSRKFFASARRRSRATKAAPTKKDLAASFTERVSEEIPVFAGLCSAPADHPPPE